MRVPVNGSPGRATPARRTVQDDATGADSSPMTTTTASHVGEQLSLAPLGLSGHGTVIGQAWSPALGQVLTVLEADRPAGAARHLLFGDRLGLVLEGLVLDGLF